VRERSFRIRYKEYKTIFLYKISFANDLKAAGKWIEYGDL